VRQAPDELVRILVRRPSWMVSAACRGKTELFYPEGEGLARTEALLLCELCPVVRECLDWALKTGEMTHGVWGGMLPRQRRRVKKAILESNGEGRYL